jgi:hypothetical protein
MWEMGSGKWTNGKWGMIASVASGLWDSKFLGKKEIWSERRIVNLEVRCSIIYRL